MTVATFKSCEPLDTYLAGLQEQIRGRNQAFLSGKLALDKASAGTVTLGYVLGLIVPPNSLCLQDQLESCQAEVRAILKNPNSAKLIEEKSRQIMSALKRK